MGSCISRGGFSEHQISDYIRQLLLSLDYLHNSKNVAHLGINVSLVFLFPVKIVTGIFSCLFDGSLVWFENETKSDGNLIIFLANDMEIPRLELFQNPCHV